MEALRIKTPDFSSSQLDVLRLLGYHHLQNGNPARAAMIFDALLAFDPEDGLTALSFACSLLRCGQLEEAMLALDGIPASHTDTALAWLLRGQALTKSGRMAEAARAMRLFIQCRAKEKS